MKELESEITKELEHMPTGRLRCTSSNGYFQYYIDGDYVGKEKREYINKVGRREYLEKLLPIVKKSIKDLSKAAFYYKERPADKCYDSLCEARRCLFQPARESLIDRIRRFNKQEYDPLPFKDNDTSEYYSNKGERVRSKSEKLIADTLFGLEIPYKYEMPLELKDGNKIIVIRPDFTILNKRTGKVVILEHFGMLDNPDYLNSAIHKINTYEKNGYLIGGSLIILHETKKNPLNTKVMNMYIKEFFL